MIDDKTLPTPRPDERQLIQAYGGGGFRIANVEYRHAVLVLSERTLALPIDDIAALLAAHLQSAIDAMPRPEIMLIGCGMRAVQIPPAARLALRQAGIAVEVMDTGAACRTHGVLLAEGRRVAAALLPIP